MIKNNFKNKILDVIKKKSISPKPKWQFLLKDYSVWFLGVTAIIIGGIATSVSIFAFVNSDWESYRYLSGSLLEHLINTAPFMWILFLILFILVADYNFTHTKKGYKYNITKVVGLTILCSLILGSMFYQVGLAHITDYELGKYFSGYQRFSEKRQQLWNRPEDGLLAGTLIPSENKDILILEDFDGNEWNVIVDKLTPMQFIILDSIDRVAFMGNIIENNLFEAYDVRPWHMRGESEFLKKRIGEQMMRAGVEHPLGLSSGAMEDIRMKFRNKNIDERNIFKLRNNMCEGE